MEYSEFFSFQI